MQLKLQPCQDVGGSHQVYKQLDTAHTAANQNLNMYT